MHLSKDEQILYNHFEDMYDIAYNRGVPIYSDFMGLNNVELAYMLLENKGIPKKLYDKKYAYMEDMAEQYIKCSVSCLSRIMI